MKRILTIAITVAAIAAISWACPSKEKPKPIAADNSYVYDKTNTPIAWAGVYDKNDVYTIWLAKTAPASTVAPVTIENGVIITLPKALLGVASTIGSNGVVVKLNTIAVDGTTVLVTIEGTKLTVDIPNGTVGGKYFDSRYSGAFTVVEDEVIPDTPFIDQLVGTWEVDEYFIYDNSGYMYAWNVARRLTITKINETIIEVDGFTGIHRFQEEEPGVIADKVRASIDNDAKTMNIPANRQFTPTWYEGYKTYVTPFTKMTETSFGFADSFNDPFPAQTFATIDGKLTMTMMTQNEWFETPTGKDRDYYYSCAVVLTKDGETPVKYYWDFIFIGTRWTKISDQILPLEEPDAAPRANVKMSQRAVNVPLNLHIGK